MPRDIRPMWVEEQRTPFDRPGWVFEIKYDGFRAIAEVDADSVGLYSRNLRSMAIRYPPIVSALREFSGRRLVLDGEIVVLSEDGRPGFQALRHYTPRRPADLRYFAFDLLYLDGYDLRSLPLLRRKGLLRDVVESGREYLGYVDHFEEEGRLFFEAVREQGLEGMVAKKADSPYRADDGTRNTRRGEWIKVKHYIRRGWDETVVRERVGLPNRGQ